MNKKLWRGAIVGGAMAIGLIAVPASLSTNTWVAGPMISDPMDLNHYEAKAYHTQWAAEVKAAKEQAIADAKKAEAEAARRTAEIGAAQGPPKANTTPRTPAASVQPRDQWMETYNYWSARLPGTWNIGEPIGSWGAASPDTGKVWIARRTPLWALKSVMIHEAGHVMQGRVFGGHNAAVRALAPAGLERTADCWALAHGATWVNYGCDPEARRVFLANPF